MRGPCDAQAAAGPLGGVVGNDHAAASRSFKVANPRLRSKLVCCLPSGGAAVLLLWSLLPMGVGDA